MNLLDKYDRTIDYMRISVTDRCNLGCLYCKTENTVISEPKERCWLRSKTPQGINREVLSYDEIYRIVMAAAVLGVKKIRITGGEPLVRRDVYKLIKMLRSIETITDISMTTNGILLEKNIEKLADAGLDRVNISMDSLIPSIYKEITRGGDIDTVIRGVEAAEKFGLQPIKINMVPIKGLNDCEIEDFVRLAIEKAYQVRFIELMPYGKNQTWNRERFISAGEIQARIEKMAVLTPVRFKSPGVARYYRINGSDAVVGFISPVSNHFCATCNRLRLTSKGMIKPCLFSDKEIDIATIVRKGAGVEDIVEILLKAVGEKSIGHNGVLETVTASMSEIGG
jgi:cyclic pyranopterin phosphate synthase